MSEAGKASHLLDSRKTEFILTLLRQLRPKCGGEATRQTLFLVGKIIFLLPEATKKFWLLTGGCLSFTGLARCQIVPGRASVCNNGILCMEQIGLKRNTSSGVYTRVGTLIVATIYLQLIQNRYMFRSFTVLQCSHQHCVQPVASDDTRAWALVTSTWFLRWRNHFVAFASELFQRFFRR